LGSFSPTKFHEQTIARGSGVAGGVLVGARGIAYQLPAKAKYTASSEAITTPFFQFEKGKVFWADEVRRMQSKK